jgi:hypothetical protein
MKKSEGIGMWMKCRYLYLLGLVPVVLQAQQPQTIIFNEYFVDRTFRIDYYHSGDARGELITLDRCYVYGSWAGSCKRLVDDLSTGRYYARINDCESGQLIFSRGFDSYFGEYKTGKDASRGIARTYHESVRIPMPKKKIQFTLLGRDRNNQLNQLFSTEIDPQGSEVVSGNIVDPALQVKDIHISGDPHERVDIVFLAEGYTVKEAEKFNADLQRFTTVLLNFSLYRSRQDRFNIYGVFKPSAESGVDEPDAGVFKSTLLHATFNSLGSARYLLTEDNKSVQDLAAHVPFDAVCIMVNHARYGGGGIYNLFCTFTVDNQWHEYLFLHEFGHSFAGLADEYYTSDVAYKEFYPPGVEPLECNITALLDPRNVKWKKWISASTVIPTPWEKTEYDRKDSTWQMIRRELMKKMAQLKRDNASGTEIKAAQDEFENLDRTHNAEMDTFLQNSKYKDCVGAFEGAGYASQGLYRPMTDCIMFSKGTKPFCKVCELGIIRVVEMYIQ